MLICGVYIKPHKLPAMVGGIVVVGVLTCTLVHSMCDLKAAKMNVQHRLIQEIMLYANPVSSTQAVRLIVQMGVHHLCKDNKSI